MPPPPRNHTATCTVNGTWDISPAIMWEEIGRESCYIRGGKYNYRDGHGESSPLPLLKGLGLLTKTQLWNRSIACGVFSSKWAFSKLLATHC